MNTDEAAVPAELLTEGLIRQLHQARQAEVEAKQTVDELQAELEANPLYGRYQRWKELQKQARTASRHFEAKVKDALLEPALAGDRHPAVHAVRSKLVLEYDEDEALWWSRDNLPDAIKLDRRVFEKYCKEAFDSEFLPIPFEQDGDAIVTFRSEHSLSIKRDLSEFVGEDEDA